MQCIECPTIAALRRACKRQSITANTRFNWHTHTELYCNNCFIVCVWAIVAPPNYSIFMAFRHGRRHYESWEAISPPTKVRGTEGINANNISLPVPPKLIVIRLDRPASHAAELMFRWCYYLLSELSHWRPIISPDALNRSSPNFQNRCITWLEIINMTFFSQLLNIRCYDNRFLARIGENWHTPFILHMSWHSATNGKIPTWMRALTPPMTPVF